MADELSWDRLGHHLLESLKALNKSVEGLQIATGNLQQSIAQMNAQVGNLQGDTQEIKIVVAKHSEEIAVLKFKSGMWGAIAGVITAAGAILIQKIK